MPPILVAVKDIKIDFFFPFALPTIWNSSRSNNLKPISNTVISMAVGGRVLAPWRMNHYWNFYDVIVMLKQRQHHKINKYGPPYLLQVKKEAFWFTGEIYIMAQDIAHCDMQTLIVVGSRFTVCPLGVGYVLRNGWWPTGGDAAQSCWVLVQRRGLDRQQSGLLLRQSLSLKQDLASVDIIKQLLEDERIPCFCFPRGPADPKKC